MTTYNTHLASEFYVLSVLHRLGIDANLTLGNKKAVDIVIVRGVAETVTVDVKGLAGTTGWPADNLNVVSDEHFVVLVCYLNRISDPSVIPESYVVPSISLRKLTYNAPGGRKLIRLSTMRKDGADFHNAWHLLK
jgi:hypothetical protein